MARNKNKFNQPSQSQTTTALNSNQVNSGLGSAVNNSTVDTQSQEINKLQAEIEQLGFNLDVEKESNKEKEAELTKREQELVAKELEAKNGFKNLEAESRQEWLQEKEREIQLERERIIEDGQKASQKILTDARTEAKEIINNAQRLKTEAQIKADQIVKEAERLADEYRQDTRKKLLQERQQQEEEINSLRQEFRDWEKILYDKERTLADEDENILLRQNKLKNQEKELEEENNWLAAQKQKLQQRERELIQRENACSEVAISRLQAEKTGIEQQLQIIQQENYRLREELQQNHRLLQTVSGSPERLMQDNRILENKLREYEQLFEQYPTELELAELRRRAEAAIDFEARYRDLQAKVDDLERLRSQHQNTRLEIDSLRKERDTLKLLNDYLREQIKDLEQMLGNLREKKLQAFSNFAYLDTEPQIVKDSIQRVNVNNLHQLASQTRAWMASLPTREELEMGMSDSSLFAHYYDEHTIQAFIASMAASRLIIIQGVSGTGKTSLPEYFAYAVGGKFARVEVQSSWRDKLDLIGAYNSFFRVFNDTPFSRAIYEAGTKPYCNYPYFIVLDEMNLSRVEYYFADLLSIMEGRPEDREIELLNHDPSGGLLPQGLRTKNGAVKLPIPENVWFIGTANTDESTYEITRKVYDRAQVLQIDEPFHRESFNPTTAVNLQIPIFKEAVQNAIANFNDSNQQAVHNCIQHIGLELHEYFQVGYGQRLLDQLSIFLPTYIAAGGTLGKGLDHFIARKLLWQVQNRTDPNIRAGLQEVRDTIEQNFSSSPQLTTPTISLNLLDREINKFKR
jgi:acyl transferase domain-containing protein